MTFWKEYFDEVSQNLAGRSGSFKKIFKYLDDLKCKEVFIVETGCYREENNYDGDGCSTLLFDNYVKHRGGNVIAIDINPEACKLARDNTSNKVEVICGDSVEELGYLEGKVDLLYLDSFNITDWGNDWESSSHHLKELFAAKNAIKPGTLIVVDDNLPNPKTNVIPLRVGKGRIISELMDGLDIEPYINDYQMGWIWKELD